MERKPRNIYEINLAEIDQKVWIAANTIIQALKIYCEDCRRGIDQMDDADRIFIIPKHKWNELHLQDVDKAGIKTTLYEIMKTTSHPQVIGETK